MPFAAGPATSGDVVDTVLIVYGMRRLAAAAASAASASGQISPVSPTGAMPIGEAYFTPNSSVSTDGSNLPLSSWGVRVILASASLLRSTAWSAPVPLARYSQAKNGIRRRARRSRSLIAGYRAIKSASIGVLPLDPARLGQRRTVVPHAERPRLAGGSERDSHRTMINPSPVCDAAHSRHRPRVPPFIGALLALGLIAALSGCRTGSSDPSAEVDRRANRLAGGRHSHTRRRTPTDCR